MENIKVFWTTYTGVELTLPALGSIGLGPRRIRPTLAAVLGSLRGLSHLEEELTHNTSADTSVKWVQYLTIHSVSVTLARPALTLARGGILVNDALVLFGDDLGDVLRLDVKVVAAVLALSPHLVGSFRFSSSW